MTKHFILIGASFIGGALLAPGSRVTSDDLGTYIDPKDQLEKPVKPGATLVEVTEDGRPANATAAAQLRDLVVPSITPEAAPVAPFSPNPTRPQGSVQQPPGGVQFAERDIGLRPALGVEDDEAAAARAAHADEQARTALAMGRGSPQPERVQRRGGDKAASPRRAAPKPRAKTPAPADLAAAAADKPAGD